MGATFTLPNDIQNGTTADADEVMANFNTILSNFTPTGMDDASANIAAMQTTVDPFPGSSESLAVNLAGELHRLRFLLKQVTGEAQWYIDPDGSMADVFTNTATFAGKKTFSNNVIFTKGADVASAAALPIITDGNYFDVTGTDAITSIDTVGVGATIRLHFDAALTLTHDATDLVLPGAADITTAVGDEFEFTEYATGDWRCTGYALASGKAVAADLTLQTEADTSSGTSHDFTGIPSFVRRITIMFVGVSTNGTSITMVQLGDSGGFEASNYLGSVSNIGSTTINHNTGFTIASSQAATDIVHGTMVLTLEDAANNVWTITGGVGLSDKAEMRMLSGSKALSGVLTQIRITMVNGTDAFDAGGINVIWE